MQLKFNLTLSTEENRHFDVRKDTMYVSGSGDYLGNWDLTRAVEMKLKTHIGNRVPLDKISNISVSSMSMSSATSASDLFTYELSAAAVVAGLKAQSDLLEFEATVDIDAHPTPHHYKYFYAQKSTISKEKIFLKQIEYHHRHIEGTADDPTITVIHLNDKWPINDTEENLSKTHLTDSGWLLENENEFQFHFCNSPLQLWSQQSEPNSFWIEIVPWRANNGLYELKDFVLDYTNFDSKMVVDERKSKFNALNLADFYSSFRLRTYENPLDLLFQINLHEIDDDGKVGEKIIATSYFKVSKALTENSIVEVDLSLLNSNQIIGSLKTEILLITGLHDQANYHIRKNFNYHFNRSCIPIGHRGMGKTFDADSTLPRTHFVENTIESFREAYNRGAQMVEFDIVLTKDKIPIVYHDFTFCLDHLTEKPSDDYLSLSVNQLTYDEVKKNRIYSQKILKSATKNPPGKETRDFFTSKLMFPTLKEMSQQLDPKLGFNVEIKYPLDLEDGSHELDSNIRWLNRNEYVDVVIKELYQWCGDEQRCVIISTFDPNLCSMLRMKQNKFPVLFLTNGVTNKWKPYKDARTRNTQRSLNFAKAESLHGLVAHAEELTTNMHLINILFSNTSRSANFLAYSWGDDMNEVDKRKLMSQSGFNGIIYDRINLNQSATASTSAEESVE